MIRLIRLLGLTGGLRLVMRLMLDRRVPVGAKLIIPFAILYILSPIDLIADFLPFAGRLDDLLVALIALTLFIALSPKDVVMGHAPDKKAGSSNDQRSDRRDVIEGSFRYEKEDDHPGR